MEVNSLTQMNKGILVTVFYCYGLLLIPACSHTPEQTVTQPTRAKVVAKQRVATEYSKTGQQIARLAKSLVGKPYRYGGSSPTKGFDCSGLVYYTHGKLGIPTPRTSRQQYSSAKPIRLSQLESGDVVFFKLSGKKVSHVGIYIGQGRFVHAPSTGKRVATNRLNDSFWKSRIVGSGRLY